MPSTSELPRGDETYLVQGEGTWAVVNPSALDANADPAAGGDPAEVGAWDPPREWQVVAIHALVLPTGKVLQYSWPAGGSGSRARVWDPATGHFTHVDWHDDMFCSGLSHLADGRVSITCDASLQ